MIEIPQEIVIAEYVTFSSLDGEEARQANRDALRQDLPSNKCLECAWLKPEDSPTDAAFITRFSNLLPADGSFMRSYEAYPNGVNVFVAHFDDVFATDDDRKMPARGFIRIRWLA